MARRRNPDNDAREPCTADHVLATFTDSAELTAYAASLGAEREDFASLPDTVRPHWLAEFVAETTNRLEAEGVLIADWARSVELARILAASRVRPIAGASAGLL